MWESFLPDFASHAKNRTEVKVKKTAVERQKALKQRMGNPADAYLGEAPAREPAPSSDAAECLTWSGIQACKTPPRKTPNPNSSPPAAVIPAVTSIHNPSRAHMLTHPHPPWHHTHHAWRYPVTIPCPVHLLRVQLLGKGWLRVVSVTALIVGYSPVQPLLDPINHQNDEGAAGIAGRVGDSTHPVPLTLSLLCPRAECRVSSSTMIDSKAEAKLKYNTAKIKFPFQDEDLATIINPVPRASVNVHRLSITEAEGSRKKGKQGSVKAGKRDDDVPGDPSKKVDKKTKTKESKTSEVSILPNPCPRSSSPRSTAPCRGSDSGRHVAPLLQTMLTPCTTGTLVASDAHTRTHAHTHARTHTHTHTQIYTHTYTHAHIHTHAVPMPCRHHTYTEPAPHRAVTLMSTPQHQPQV